MRRAAGSAREDIEGIDRGAPSLPAGTLAFCLRYGRIYLLFVCAIVVLEAGQSACSIMLPYAIKRIMDGVAAAQAGSGAVLDLVEAPLWLFALLNLGVVVFSRASGTLLVILGPELRRRVRRELFAYLQHHSQRYFMSNFAGSLANRIAEVAMSVAYTLWTVLFDFWPLAIAFGVSLVLLGGVSLQLAGVLGAWVAVYVTVSFLLAQRCRRYARDYAAARSVVSGKIVDSVSNIMNAKLFARRDFERAYLDDYLDLEVSRARRTFWFMEGIRWFQFLAAMLLMIGVIGYALRVWSAGGMGAGDFAMAASLSLLLIEQARGLSRRFLDFFEYLGNINDGVAMIVRPHEIVDRAAARPLVVSRGEIRFERVGFGYGQERRVFEELDLVIHAGERVGLVGYSGSGKSTLVNLALRLFEPQAGRVLIDGQDVAGVTQESLRAAVAMIPQDPMLFHRSLMENIRYGRLDASDEEVREAARRAHADEFIMATAEGYDSLVGERGVKLSGGQRQRIALARAILKQAPILLLDEATSALDSVTERNIQDSLAHLMQGRTVVVIAHRLSTLAHLDRIVVFHEGRILESGSHAELLARGGHYAHMWQMQAGGFLPERDDEGGDDAAAMSAG
ncbi:MAG: ABC transporter ATP-binding protein [Gammaproteobacteria bacterium]|nr:ABC transporter ATP-binding protein [Gammaproteobacteria bacterium]MCP5201293.1 ABC transporter ATP-binding protein [Gammaproteobacteria bacterium]